jgi:8-oxo-dGTP diphosphatase
MLLHVAVAVIEDAQGRVLLARRADHLHQGGLWEFPGGKLEPGEGLAQALSREIHEELGLQVRSHRPLIQIWHDYADRRVLLDVHRLTDWRGEPHGREGQPLAWVAPEQLDQYPMPAADRPIVTAVRLPARYLITGPCHPGQEAAYLNRLQSALQQGLRLVQLRPGARFPPSEMLLDSAVDLCREQGAALLLNSRHWHQGLSSRALGIHLTSGDLHLATARPAVSTWVGASCHDADDLRQAQRIGVDFAVLSPVLSTESHPEAVPLGWDRLHSLLQQTPFPVYALGGTGRVAPELAWSFGAQGVAGIGGLW